MHINSESFAYAHCRSQFVIHLNALDQDAVLDLENLEDRPNL